MPEQSDMAPPPLDTPPIGAANPGWGGMLAALTALVLVAIVAFWLIGTWPKKAPVIIEAPHDAVSGRAAQAATTTTTQFTLAT
jgi:hypothetical protein